MYVNHKYYFFVKVSVLWYNSEEMSPSSIGGGNLPDSGGLMGKTFMLHDKTVHRRRVLYLLLLLILVCLLTGCGNTNPKVESGQETVVETSSQAETEEAKLPDALFLTDIMEAGDFGYCSSVDMDETYLVFICENFVELPQDGGAIQETVSEDETKESAEGETQTETVAETVAGDEEGRYQDVYHLLIYDYRKQEILFSQDMDEFQEDCLGSVSIEKDGTLLVYNEYTKEGLRYDLTGQCLGKASLDPLCFSQDMVEQAELTTYVPSVYKDYVVAEKNNLRIRWFKDYPNQYFIGEGEENSFQLSNSGTTLLSAWEGYATEGTALKFAVADLCHGQALGTKTLDFSLFAAYRSDTINPEYGDASVSVMTGAVGEEYAFLYLEFSNPGESSIRIPYLYAYKNYHDFDVELGATVVSKDDIKSVTKAYRKEVSDQYGVEILHSKKGLEDYNHKVKGKLSYLEEYVMLRSIDEILGQFPENLCREIPGKLFEKFRIYLVKRIKGTAVNGGSTAAYASNADGIVYIVMASETYSPENFVHELWHTMEWRVSMYYQDRYYASRENQKKYQLFDDMWEKLNPKSFTYLYDREATKTYKKRYF